MRDSSLGMMDCSSTSCSPCRIHILVQAFEVHLAQLYPVGWNVKHKRLEEAGVSYYLEPERKIVEELHWQEVSLTTPPKQWALECLHLAPSALRPAAVIITYGHIVATARCALQKLL